MLFCYIRGCLGAKFYIFTILGAVVEHFSVLRVVWL